QVVAWALGNYVSDWLSDKTRRHPPIANKRCGCQRRHIQIQGPIRSFCVSTSNPLKKRKFPSKRITMNSKRPHLVVDHRVLRSFKTLDDRTIRKQRSEERRLAEQRITKYRFQARKSCIPDARSYRVARRLLFLRALFALDTQV